MSFTSICASCAGVLVPPVYSSLSERNGMIPIDVVITTLLSRPGRAEECVPDPSLLAIVE